MNSISSLQVLAAAAVLMVATGIVSGQAGVDQSLKQRVAGSAANLTSYSYVIDAVADVHLSSSISDLHSNISSHTLGAVDIAKGAAALSVTNWKDGGVVRERRSFLMDGMLYSNAGQGWQKQAAPNSTQAMFTFDELRGQSRMLIHSEIAPEVSIDEYGRKVVSTLPEEIRGTLIRGQIMGAYFTLAGEMLNLTIEDVVKNSKLMNGSTVQLTSWIDQETGALVKNKMNVEIDVAPDILRLPGNERLRIDLTQTSAFSGFDLPTGIELPDDAENARPIDGESGDKRDCPLCNKEITA